MQFSVFSMNDFDWDLILVSQLALSLLSNFRFKYFLVQLVAVQDVRNLTLNSIPDHA